MNIDDFDLMHKTNDAINMASFMTVEEVCRIVIIWLSEVFVMLKHDFVTEKCQSLMLLMVTGFQDGCKKFVPCGMHVLLNQIFNVSMKVTHKVIFFHFLLFQNVLK